MVSPVFMYCCVTCMIKLCRIHSFELWCCKRLLRVPWTTRSNQSILKEINPNTHWKHWCSCWSSSTLATWKNWLIWKDPDTGKGQRQEEKGMTEDKMFWWHHWQWIWVWASSGSWWWTGSLRCCSQWVHKELDLTECLNWTELWQLGPSFPSDSDKETSCDSGDLGLIPGLGKHPGEENG